jgi:hypothetical protein
MPGRYTIFQVLAQAMTRIFSFVSSARYNLKHMLLDGIMEFNSPPCVFEAIRCDALAKQRNS